MKGIRMLISKNDLVLSNEEVYVKLFVIFKDKKYIDQLYNRFSFTNKDTDEKFKVIYEKAKQYIEEKG